MNLLFLKNTSSKDKSKNTKMIRKFILQEAKGNSSYITTLCKHNILFKKNVFGWEYYGIDKHEQNNSEDILNFFKNMEQAFYEVLHSTVNTKIYMDCEFDNVDIQEYEKRYELFLLFDSSLRNFLSNNGLNNDHIVYSDASRLKKNKYKISLHVLINNCGIFKNRNILKKLVNNFIKELGPEFTTKSQKFVDTKVYSVNQLFKCVFSPSKDSAQKLIPFRIIDGKLKFIDEIFVVNNIQDFLVGSYKDENILDNKFDNLKENIQKLIQTEKTITSELKKEVPINSYLPNNTRKWIERNNYVKNIFKIRNNKIINNKLDLTRISPGYCNICKRDHDNENAFCKIYKNNIVFYCGRNPNGAVIGSWYKKETHQNNKLDINNNVSNKIFDKIKDENSKYISYIEELKNKNKELEKEITSLKNYNKEIIKINNELMVEVKKIKENKNIKYNTKNKSTITSSWNKYYLLAVDIMNGKKSNIEKEWKDANISRLKSRAFRVKEYIDTLKENNLTNNLSLRNIFHIPNYKFLNLINSLRI